MMQQHAYTAEPAQAALSAAERSALRALLEHAHCFYAPGAEGTYLLVPVSHSVLDTLAEFEEHDGREPDPDFEPDSDTEPNGDELDFSDHPSGVDGGIGDIGGLLEQAGLFDSSPGALGHTQRHATAAQRQADRLACRDAAKRLARIVNREIGA